LCFTAGYPSGDLAVGRLRGDIRLRGISTVCSALAVAVALAFPLAAAAHEFVATVTLAEGQSVLIDGAHRYVSPTGVRLRHADNLQTYMRTKVQDPAFRTELIAHMRDYLKWDLVLGR
jgi:hypothetical protein